ncbi:hypothetical protein Tco_0833548 [Tanacetum coccineum]
MRDHAKQYAKKRIEDLVKWSKPWENSCNLYTPLYAFGHFNANESDDVVGSIDVPVSVVLPTIKDDTGQDFSLLVSWMVTDLEDLKTHTVGGVWYGEYMDHGFTKSMPELDRCYTMLQELRSVIVCATLIYKNREGSKHEGRRIRPTIDDFGGNCASNQSPFINGRTKEWKEEKKVDRVSTTKIFRSKICSLIIDGCSINNLVSRKLVDFLKLPMEICPIEGYQVCRVPVTIEKSYKVEALCIEGRIIAMVPPTLTPQLPKPDVKVEEKIVKAKVVDEHIEKIQDLRNYIQHDDKNSTLFTSKTCEEITGFNDDEDVKVLREKVFEVDELLDIENSSASSFQVRGIHFDETKVDAVRDWSSPKTLVEFPTEPHHSPYQIGWIKKVLALKVTEICKVPLAIGKHYNELVTCDVVDIEACHVLLERPWQHDMDATHQGVVSPKTKLENKTLVTLMASPKEFQADIIGPIMAAEDEPFMMLGSGPNIIKEDFSNDLDGQHSADENIYEIHSEDMNEDEHSRTSSFKERGNDEDMIQELTKKYM